MNIPKDLWTEAKIIESIIVDSDDTAERLTFEMWDFITTFHVGNFRLIIPITMRLKCIYVSFTEGDLREAIVIDGVLYFVRDGYDCSLYSPTEHTKIEGDFYFLTRFSDELIAECTGWYKTKNDYVNYIADQRIQKAKQEFENKLTAIEYWREANLKK